MSTKRRDDFSEPEIDSDEMRRRYPAARCRGCGCVTHTCSILKGVRTLARPKHWKGCEMPVGRLHLRTLAANLVAGRREYWFARLRQSMSDIECAATFHVLMLEIDDDSQ